MSAISCRYDLVVSTSSSSLIGRTNGNILPTVQELATVSGPVGWWYLTPFVWSKWTRATRRDRAAEDSRASAHPATQPSQFQESSQRDGRGGKGGGSPPGISSVCARTRERRALPFLPSRCLFSPPSSPFRLGLVFFFRSLLRFFLMRVSPSRRRRKKRGPTGRKNNNNTGKHMPTKNQNNNKTGDTRSSLPVRRNGAQAKGQ